MTTEQKLRVLYSMDRHISPELLYVSVVDLLAIWQEANSKSPTVFALCEIVEDNPGLGYMTAYQLLTLWRTNKLKL